MKYSLSLAVYFLLIFTAQAQSLPGIPSLNDIPILYDMLGSQPKYREALFKTQEALLIETGIPQKIDATRQFILNKAKSGVISLVDTYSPINSRSIFVIYSAVQAWDKKEVSGLFDNPFCHKIKHSLTLGLDRQYLGTQIPL